MGQQALPARAEACKNAGNRAYFERAWAAAVAHYSDGVACAPGSALLHANRAAALLARGWEGDAWAALQDCEAAVRLNPGSVKSHYRLMQALKALGLLQVFPCCVCAACCDISAARSWMLRTIGTSPLIARLHLHLYAALPGTLNRLWWRQHCGGKNWCPYRCAQEALAAVQAFVERFPGHARDAGRLREGIEAALSEARKRAEAQRAQALSRRRARAEVLRVRARAAARRPHSPTAAEGDGSMRTAMAVAPVNPFGDMVAAEEAAGSSGAAGRGLVMNGTMEPDTAAATSEGRAVDRHEHQQQGSTGAEGFLWGGEEVPGPPPGDPPGWAGFRERVGAVMDGSVEEDEGFRESSAQVTCALPIVYLLPGLQPDRLQLPVQR